MFLRLKYSNFYFIIKGLYTAVLFSAFIYFSHFDLSNKLINSVLGLLSIYTLLTINKISLFWSGFFVGIFWFWWVSISFIHYDLNYLVPIVVLFFGVGYGLFFYLTAFINKIWFRALAIFGLTYFEPFGFNWLKPELLFVESYFSINKLEFASILLSIVIFIKMRNEGRGTRIKEQEGKFHFPPSFRIPHPASLIFPLIPLLFAFDFKQHTFNHPPLTIYMPQLNISQDDKWDKKYSQQIIDTNMKHIDYAIKEGYDLVILPETAFPFILNKRIILVDSLLEKSKQIAIVAGSLHSVDFQYHNSTYFFNKGEMQIAHKLILVPFGEAVPFPEKIRDWINNTFYDGASDYSVATYASDFEIKGIKFRNAICYEATTDKIFLASSNDTAGTRVKFMLAISNNAWFTPSIQPTLQKLLLKYYAKKYDVTIFNSTNKSKNSVIGNW